jgi:ETC complex I subunit conserved region
LTKYGLRANGHGKQLTGANMPARIYQRAKNAMQSGKALTDQWVLEFEAAEARRADPLMGWSGSGDTQTQVQLKFNSLDAAKAYAEKNEIVYIVVTPAAKVLKIQAYADNFR